MATGSANWSLQEQDSRRIHQILQRFLRESEARCALLVDRTGQLVTMAGERLAFDPTAFSSLAAADFSANDQLASMIGEGGFSSVIHQGERESIYLADVAKRVILVTLFDDRTTLGMIRIKAKHVVRELSAVFHELPGRQTMRQLPPQLETAFVDEAESEIDRLFRDL